jgi:hypothetical protein
MGRMEGDAAALVPQSGDLDARTQLVGEANSLRGQQQTRDRTSGSMEASADPKLGLAGMQLFDSQADKPATTDVAYSQQFKDLIDRLCKQSRNCREVD